MSDPARSSSNIIPAPRTPLVTRAPRPRPSDADLLAYRRFGRVFPQFGVRCGEWHHIPAFVHAVPCGCAQCPHVDPTTKARCGEWVWMLTVGAAHLTLVKPISYEEATRISSADLSPLEQARLLGLTL